MRKLLTIGMLIGVVLGLGSWSIARADVFPIYFSDLTDAEKWLSGSEPKSTGRWTSAPIGDNFQTYGGKFDFNSNNLYLYLYTKFGPEGVAYRAANKTIYPADLFIDTNLVDDKDGGFRNYNLAIRLRSDGQEKVYTGFSIVNSIDIMTGSASNWIFGGRFDTGGNYIQILPPSRRKFPMALLLVKLRSAGFLEIFL